VVAALDLFAAQGYENTTVIEIAKRAGVTKSTFFRHFSDKRQVLFGQDVVAGPLARGIAAAPPASTALGACRNHNRGKLSERPDSDSGLLPRRVAVVCRRAADRLSVRIVAVATLPIFRSDLHQLRRELDPRSGQGL